MRDYCPSGHNIQANMPPQNILKFFALGRNFGKYPLDRPRIAAEEKKLEAAKGDIG